jgi:hypothetical protein
MSFFICSSERPPLAPNLALLEERPEPEPPAPPPEALRFPATLVVSLVDFLFLSMSLLDNWPLQCRILYYLLESSPTGTSKGCSAQLVQIILKTSTILFDFNLLVCDELSQIRSKGLLKIDVVLGDVLRRTLPKTVPGIPMFPVQILETIVCFRKTPQGSPGLSISMSGLIRLVHTSPQGPRITLQIGECQSDIICILDGTKIIFDNRQPLLILVRANACERHKQAQNLLSAIVIQTFCPCSPCHHFQLWQCLTATNFYLDSTHLSRRYASFTPCS